MDRPEDGNDRRSMANNRARLKCRRCPKDAGFSFLKYYPSQGWYLNRSENKLAAELDAWLDTHKHGELFGAHLYLELETMGREDMSFAREALLGEISRLEKEIEEKRAIQRKLQDDRTNANTEILNQNEQVRKMSERVRELKKEVDKMPFPFGAWVGWRTPWIDRDKVIEIHLDKNTWDQILECMPPEAHFQPVVNSLEDANKRILELRTPGGRQVWFEDDRQHYGETKKVETATGMVDDSGPMSALGRSVRRKIDREMQEAANPVPKPSPSGAIEALREEMASCAKRAAEFGLEYNDRAVKSRIISTQMAEYFSKRAKEFEKLKRLETVINILEGK